MAGPDAWEIVTPRWSYGSLPARNAALYAQVLDQFDVEHAARYQPRNGDTYCNIFVWDATKACGCEIPHWLYGEERSANGNANWLAKYGAEHGWVRVDAEHAQQRANAGFPVVAVWRNPGAGKGHIAMVRPSPDPGRLRIAQAGQRNYNDAPLSAGFGGFPPTFWSHD